MNQLFRLKENIVHFLSPPSKRRRTMPATPAKTDEHRYLTPRSEILDKKGEAAALVHIKQRHVSPSDIKNPRKRAREDDDEDGQIESAGFAVSPEDSVSNIEVKEESSSASGSEAVNEELEEEIEEDLKNELPAEQATTDAKVKEYLARQAELAIRLDDIEKARAESELHPDALFLYEKISMRSFEEILPLSWKMDFPTLPDELFTDNPQKQFINYKGNSSLGGVRALQSVLCLSDRVRANLNNGSSTERVMTREVKAYIKWSERDAGYYNCRFLPVLVVVTAQPNKPNSHLSTAITNQMVFLAEKHREHLANPLTGEPGEVQTYRRQPPLLYGMILAKTIAILVTLDSANPDSTVKHLTNFDFNEKSQGVWNGFGLAMMIICARNYQLSIRDEFEEEESEPDPDL